MEHVTRIERNLAYQGSIVDFYEDTMKLPDGRLTTFDFIKHKGAAAIVPVDENGKIIMVRQYRNAIDRFTLEIPAGAINPGEDMRSAAIRECEEEIGYLPKVVDHLMDLYTTVAFCNEKIGIYCTRELEKTSQHLDEDEYIEVERYTVAELIEKILQGEIEDAKTISAILAYKAKYDVK